MGSTKSNIRVPKSDAFSYVDSPMIRVLVGNEEVPKEFHVHEALICSRSDFFKNALKKPWLEAEEWKVTLAKEEPEIFSLYLKFLYSNKLPIYEAPAQFTCAEEYSALCKLYVLADMLLDDSIKSIIVDCIAEKAQEVDKNGNSYAPGYDCLDMVYAGTLPGNPARALLARLWVDFEGDVSQRTAEEWPKEFLMTIPYVSRRIAILPSFPPFPMTVDPHHHRTSDDIVETTMSIIFETLVLKVIGWLDVGLEQVEGIEGWLGKLWVRITERHEMSQEAWFAS